MKLTPIEKSKPVDLFLDRDYISGLQSTSLRSPSSLQPLYSIGFKVRMLFANNWKRIQLYAITPYDYRR